MPNLFPNMEVQQYKGSDDFIFAAPLEPEVWTAVLRKSVRLADRTIEARYWRTTNTWNDKPIVVLLRGSHHTDDEMLQAGAWLRMVDGISDRIYCTPSSKVYGPPLPSMYAGARGELCAMFEI